MECPYANNRFYNLLTPELRKTLCGCCTTVRYPAGNVFNRNRWNGTLAVLLDGFVISADPKASDEGTFIPLELAGSGHLLSIPQDWTSVKWNGVSCFVIQDSMIALYDRTCIEALYKNNIDFVKALCEGYIIGYHEMAIAFQEIGGNGAQAAVKYVLQFCKEHGIPQLTHAQIALAAGLTRPTVTKSIHELLKNDPELFLPKNAVI